jgi:ankyrin repeat protein
MDLTTKYLMMGTINSFWQEITKHLKAQKIVNGRDKREKFPSHEAACVGVDEIQKALEDASINIDDPSCLAKTALHYATAHGHKTVVSFLLREKADINKLDRYGQSALHEAVVTWNGDQTIVDTLLEGGACVNLQDVNGETALHLASRNGNETIIEKLLERQADVSLTNKRNKIALRLVGKTSMRRPINFCLEHHTAGQLRTWTTSWSSSCSTWAKMALSRRTTIIGHCCCGPQ